MTARGEHAVDVSLNSLLVNLGGFLIGAPVGAFITVRWVKARYHLTPKPPAHKEST